MVPKTIDPHPKVEEGGKGCEESSREYSDSGPGKSLHPDPTLAPATDSQRRYEDRTPTGVRSLPLDASQRLPWLVPLCVGDTGLPEVSMPFVTFGGVEPPKIQHSSKGSRLASGTPGRA